jgi:hypothetical protein
VEERRFQRRDTAILEDGLQPSVPSFGEVSQENTATGAEAQDPAHPRARP